MARRSDDGGDTVRRNGKQQAAAGVPHVPKHEELKAQLEDRARRIEDRQRQLEQRRLALVHVRALRRSAARLPWWKRPLYWARLWRETRP